jgi:precorrin-6A/cobalt-precorrin-6A reductase
VGEAAEATGATPQNVFLTIGRQELAPFKLYRHKYVIRSVERPDAAELPQGAKIITARGPFAEPDERALLMQHRIDCVVTKNSGGVTSAKIEAARALSLPVIIVARPEKPAMQAVTTVPDALAWLHEKVFDGSGLIETVRGV